MPTLAALLHRVLRPVLSLLAPPQCRLCRAALLDHRNPFLCPRCLAGLHWIGPDACQICGTPAGRHAVYPGGCRNCMGKGLRLSAAAGVVRYRRGARALVTALKFGHELEIARPMAALMAQRLASADLPVIDWILPVPLHPQRLRQRGFDQSALLGTLLADATGLPFRPGCIAKIRHTLPQSTLGSDARFQNIAHAFRASDELAGRSVLLVDDVMTTGATMGECARACRDAGARKVSALVFAR